MAGGEEQEDYMGDLSQFLPPEVSQSSDKKAPSANPAVSNPSSKKSKAQNWQEQRKLKRERKQIEEDKQTLENLGSAIPQSNIGFKLLKQMGYTPGSALGKEGSGRSEPVALEIRRSRAGIGKEDPKMEKMRRENENEERKKRKEQELMEVFGSHQKQRWKGRRIVVNFRKAEAALAQLENRDVVEVEKNEEEDKEKEEEEEEEEITEEDLLNILMKLRNEFHYCLFCGCQYETMEELLSNCPGINEDDH
ncbi:putative RNA binding protein [Handroanthus impetiginosus]|uniref:Putative RNA binding protein n=1 Tax=Handroanthus impetiginosus TaxID=429701 RepID=A0A2G9H6S6_9LAMI|nr:putative RNA binding protein [Handroanthus impetiginosus]